MTSQELVEAVRILGYYPKEFHRPATPEEEDERLLAHRIRKGLIKANFFTQTQITELDELRRTSIHPRDREKSDQLLLEAQEEPSPMEGFADEAENRLDQDLLLLSSGHRTRQRFSQQQGNGFCTGHSLSCQMDFKPVDMRSRDTIAFAADRMQSLSSESDAESEFEIGFGIGCRF